MKTEPTGREKDTHINIRINPEAKKELQRVALDQSEPGKKVTLSDIAREAIEKYLEDRQ